MYINKIDDIIDQVIDSFSEEIINNKLIKKIMKEQNFIKYQKEINEMWTSYVDSIPRNKIEDIVKKTDSINSIYNSIKKYIAIYTFLLIAYHYQYDAGVYLNNIVEFSKNQVSYSFKISDFFNSVNNALIIENYHIIKNILIFEKKPNNKISDMKNLENGASTVEFLTQFDDEFIKSMFHTGDENIKLHNIVKTIIVVSIYNIQDRQDFFKLLEMSENEDGEFMFLNVSMPITQYMSYDAIISILSKEDIESGLGDKIWNYLKNIEDYTKKENLTGEENILALINTGIIVPIVDDFMLYHKETEKYEDHKNISEITDNKKKRDDTKLRYIIGKIEEVIDYNSPNIVSNPSKLQEVKKQFSAPLYNRKAIIHNVIENYKIFMKHENQGSISADNTSYLNDLSHYTSYPYINFKDFKKYGFSITANKTTIAVRQVSFENTGEFKQNPRSRIQVRTFRKGTIMNIVGFLMPGTNKFYLCDKTTDVESIRNEKEDKNAIKLVTEYYKNSILNNNASPKSKYWFFNPNIDKVITKTHEAVEKSNIQIKSILFSLYENMKNESYFKILDEIDKHEYITINEVSKIILNIEKRSLKISDDKTFMNELDNYVFTKKLLVDNEEYDTNDDILYGLEGKVYGLKENPIKNPEKKIRITVNLEKVDEKGDDNIVETVEGLCQHNITWINIMKKKKISHKEFMEDIYNFIIMYVNETHDKRYTCKSCGFELNINKYLSDGSFDNDTGRYIAFGMPMEIPLEDIPEYMKYNRTIKIMDKLVEKIASIVNISHMMGMMSNSRWKRKSIIKNTIDLLELNNKRLSHKFKERNVEADKNYSINRNMSNLFIFDLDNSIFQYSSTDKDHYKPIKINNIITYIIINMVNDISETQVSYITADDKGLCTFENFKKYYKLLFRDLKLLINNKGDTIKCVDCSVFCYLLYIISCKLSKRGIWYFENTKGKKITDNMIPNMQNSIINTVIDTMNSIMESSFEEKISYELEIYRYRFMDRLKNLFRNEEIYKMLYDSFNSSQNKKVNNQGENHPVESIYTGPAIFKVEHKWVNCQQTKIYLKKKKKASQLVNIEDLNQLTNCDSGLFHEWHVKNKVFVCDVCNKKLNTLLEDDKSNDVYDNKNVKIRENYIIKNYNELAKVYCVKGTRHKFVFDNKKEEYVCDICESTSDKIYSKEELDTMKDNIRKRQVKRINVVNKKINRQLQDADEYEEYSDKLLVKIDKKMKTDSKEDYIYKMVQEMEKIIGNDKNILKGSRLFSNTYIIDHNHLGYKLDIPIVIMDSDNKITSKKNHPFFKTDVIYYVNYKGHKIEVFYDTVSKVLLGYKEESKEYVMHGKDDVKLKVIFSIYNKLTLLGLPSQHIDTKKIYNYLFEKYQVISDTPKGKRKLYQSLVKEIIKERHDNLRKIMYDLCQSINIIIHDVEVNHNRKVENDGDIVETTYFHDKIEIIISKYISKINKIKITNSNGKKQFMKQWKTLSNSIKVGNIDNINFDDIGDIVDATQIISYDVNGNVILYYILDQIKKLIDYNDNKFIKINTVMFIIDFISYAYDLFNIDFINESKEMTRFVYVLNSSEYSKDIIEKNTVDTHGIYEEDIDDQNENDEEHKEQLLDEDEERDALDIDGPIDLYGVFGESRAWNDNQELDSISSPINIQI